MNVKNDWLNRLIYWQDSKHTASIKINCQPKTKLNLRPVMTIKGEILEWQLMLGNWLDYAALTDKQKPKPGCPLITPHVIRFHNDDISANLTES